LFKSYLFEEYHEIYHSFLIERTKITVKIIFAVKLSNCQNNRDNQSASWKSVNNTLRDFRYIRVSTLHAFFKKKKMDGFNANRFMLYKYIYVYMLFQNAFICDVYKFKSCLECHVY
jgi:hypothetical protein